MKNWEDPALLTLLIIIIRAKAEPWFFLAATWIALALPGRSAGTVAGPRPRRTGSLGVALLLNNPLL